MTTYNSLLVGGADGWHDGSGTITYSFLGAIPGYYDLVDTDDDGFSDSYDIDGRYLPYGTDASLSTDERQLAELAIRAWNQVANVNLEPGSVDGGIGNGIGAPVETHGGLVGGLGGAAGFGEIEVPRNDDGSAFYNASSTFTDGFFYFGGLFTGIWVNTNGSISFGQGISTYTPTSITGGSAQMIAPFWADVDTRIDTNPSTPNSGQIYVDLDPVKHVVTVTWANVGYFNTHADLTNSFQLQLYDRGDGDFDIVFRYADMNWTTGDVSGGSNGLGGSVAHAGYTAGDSSDFYELPQSGNQEAMLDLEDTPGNTGIDGLWVFHVRDGTLVGDVTFGSGDFDSSTLFGMVANFPGILGQSSPHGDVWLNEGNPLQAGAEYGDTGWQTYLHELGHALGLRHPDEDPDNLSNDPRNNNQWTVMSYEPHPGQTGVDDPIRAWPITPMVFDIQAMQALYGPNLSTNTDDTVYISEAGTAFALSDDGLLEDGRPAIFTIWDAGGYDTFDASDQSSSVIIDLNPGTYSTVGSIENNIGLAAAVTIGGVVVNFIEKAIGGTDDDTITGNAAANVLDGGEGADSMSGRGAGDEYFVDDTGDRVFEANEGGTDIVNSSVSFALGSQFIENLTLTGNESINGTGNNLANEITGNSRSNRIDGGTGADHMRGLAGGDTYFVDDRGDRVFEANVAGIDLVNSAITFALGPQFIENLTLTGRTNINGTGNNLANTLIGNAGNNRLDGAAGADIMRGLAGHDMYAVDNSGDRVFETSATGIDVVISSVSFNLGTQFIENLILAGFGNINGTGNSLPNAIAGNTGKNVLTGGAGRDVLTGGSGADRFDFNAVPESTRTSRDQIRDFSRSQQDRIDLSTIDADQRFGHGGNQRFVFIGNATFDTYHQQHSDVYGMVRFAGGILQANVNSNLVSDFEIAVSGLANLIERDFIL